MTTTEICQVRWLICHDHPAVFDIDPTFTQEQLSGLLKCCNVVGQVAEMQNPVASPVEFGNVVGFMIYELGDRSFHLHEFHVHRDWRRQGIGSAMMSKLASRMNRNGRYRIALEVRESNLGAQLFYRAQGFVAVRTLRRFYGDEDGYRMVLRCD